MNEQTLWMLVRHTAAETQNPYKQSQLLIDLLSEWSILHVLKFEKIYWSLMERSFDADLWAAAYVLNDGCDQEEFLHFRSWLLLQGQAAFRQVVEDSESIAEWLTLPMAHPIHYPDLQNKIVELIATKTQEPIEKRYTESEFELTGEYWRNDAELVDKVPVLCKKMGWGNQVPKGDWKTDDTPRYNSAVSNSNY